MSIDSFYTHTAVDRPNQPQTHLQTLSQNNKLQKSNDQKHLSQENLNEFQKSCHQSLSNSDIFHSTKTDFKEEDASFFDVLSKIQSNRLDDQRCSIKRLSMNKLPHFRKDSGITNILVDWNSYLIVITLYILIQTKEKNENLNAVNQTTCINAKSKEDAMLQNDEFFNLIMKSQRSRLEDQRTSMNTSKIHNSLSSRSATSSSLAEPLPSFNVNQNSNFKPNNLATASIRPSVTVPPDDAFFSMIQKIQSRRLDEQRSVIKSSKFSLKSATNNTHLMKKAYDR